MRLCPMGAYSYMALPEYRNTSSAEFCPLHMRIREAESNLRETFRMLWEQHDIWTRQTIVSIVFGLPDEGPVTNRLLINPEDFELVLKRYYGDRIASKFAELLRDHLVIAAQLVKAAKAGDNAASDDAEKRWYANADEIAAFLAGINPYWSQNDWRTMLHTHLKLVKEEAVDMLTKDYTKGVATFDEIEKQSLEMADVLASGLLDNFTLSPCPLGGSIY